MKTAKSNIDMCNGPLFINIVKYTLPLILTGLLQMFFNAADIIVIGQFRGSNSVAAIGATSSICNLLLNLFLGISTGVSATVANAIGAKNEKRVSNTVHTAIFIALIFGVFLTLTTFSLSEILLGLMDTPKKILNLSVTYMRIFSLGMTASLVYNFSAAILRASGDTKSPLVYLSIAGITNVLLNLFLVKFFNMDVEGVAIATIISQLVSAILVILKLLRVKNECRLIFSKLHIHFTELKQIVIIGVPAGLQSVMFSLSNVFIQSSINSFGASAVAGNSAASNIEGFVYVLMNSFSHTALNFTSQNIGAGKYNRISRIYKLNVLIMCSVAISVISMVLLFAQKLLGFYITNDPTAVEYGALRLQYICITYFICGIMEITTGIVRGMGSSLAPMIISVFCVCGLRILTVLTLFQIPMLHSLETLYVSYPVSWGLCIIFTFIIYLRLRKKYKSNLVAEH